MSAPNRYVKVDDYTRQVKKYVPQSNCRVTILPELFFPAGFGIALPEGSPFKLFFDLGSAFHSLRPKATRADTTHDHTLTAFHKCSAVGFAYTKCATVRVKRNFPFELQAAADGGDGPPAQVAETALASRYVGQVPHVIFPIIRVDTEHLIHVTLFQTNARRGAGSSACAPKRCSSAT